MAFSWRLCRWVAWAVAVVGGLALPRIAIAAGGMEFTTSSFLGAKGFDDSVVGTRIQSDGTIVLAANLGPDAPCRGKTPGKNGLLLRLSPDGRKLLSVVTVADVVHDLALDAKDNFCIAAGAEGLAVYAPKADRLLWRKDLPDCTRADIAADGHVAALAGKRIHIFDPDGKELAQAQGRSFTNDVCIDSASKTVVFCGFRNAHAFDGKKTYPVQICYLRGLGYDGKTKWVDYDWDTDRDSPRFLNKPTNNMADSRADRCAIGRDGKLYATFQVAGGNHLFRYSPKDIMAKVKIVGGDKYHQFYNSRAEHKCFFARYAPATGEYLAGQQLCGRLSSGRANAVVTKTGEIHADESGRVYVVGTAAYGLPLTVNPGGDYTGGAFVLIMSADLKTRLLCTRTSPGKGLAHAVDARTLGGTLRGVYGGGGMAGGMFVKAALQPKPADAPREKTDPKDAFFVVLTARP